MPSTRSRYPYFDQRRQLQQYQHRLRQYQRQRMTTVAMSRMNRDGDPVGSETDSESDPPGVPSVKGKDSSSSIKGNNNSNKGCFTGVL